MDGVWSYWIEIDVLKLKSFNTDCVLFFFFCMFQPNLRYYEQHLGLAKDLQDKLSQAKAYCNLGLAHKALGEYSKAEECQRYLLSLAQALDNNQVI